MSSILMLLLVMLICSSTISEGFFTLFPKNQNGFQQPKHAKGVKVVDYARHDLPKIRMGERTNDLTSGVHFVSLRPFGGFSFCVNFVIFWNFEKRHFER
jgi:hypothetical protein